MSEDSVYYSTPENDLKLNMIREREILDEDEDLVVSANVSYARGNKQNRIRSKKIDKSNVDASHAPGYKRDSATVKRIEISNVDASQAPGNKPDSAAVKLIDISRVD